MKRAIIVGSQGQDGRILFEQLAAAGYALLGIDQGGVFRTPDIAGEMFPAAVNILDAGQVSDMVRGFQPDEVYYLAAYHHAADDKALSDTFALVQGSYDVHVRGLLSFLEAMVRHAAKARLFYAASSLVFGEPATPVQDEETPLRPNCVYSITKTAGVHYCRLYRQKQGLFAAAGYLFNHESQYRRPEFVTQKIVQAAVSMRAGREGMLTLGSLDATVDWGYAPDYTQAMALILQQEKADDFIIATGQGHTVRDFVAAAFAAAGVDWRPRVVEDPTMVLRSRTPLVGNAARLRARTGWQPSVTFEEMVGLLVRQEARRQNVAL